MPIRHGGSCEISGSSCSRDTFGVISTALPFSSTPSVNGKDVLGDIDTYRHPTGIRFSHPTGIRFSHNAHGLPLS